MSESSTIPGIGGASPGVCSGTLRLVFLLLASSTAAISKTGSPNPVFAPDNLVPWCIVPFDSKKRNPTERAEMVARLGLKKVAYDWRGQHVPMFEEEILQYKKHGIEYFAFWSWHDAMEPLIRKHDIRPQIWRTLGSPGTGTQKEKVAAAANCRMWTAS